MKKLILLLFIPLVSFGQNITIDSVDYEPLLISENTIDYLNENGYDGNNLFGSYSQAINVDFNNDGYLDLIAYIKGTPYLPSILGVFIWNNDTNKFIENNNYLMIVEGEAGLWDNSIGDFNGDGLTDIYVPVSNYHGESGQQPDYYPFEDSMNMPGHLFLNNGNSFDSQYIDNAIHDGYGYPNYERGFVLDVDNDGVSDIIVPSVNQHPENTPSNNFLVTKYNVDSNNEIVYNFIYQWQNTFDVPDFYITTHSVIVREYNNNIYILYTGYEEWTSNGPYMYPEVSIYSKDIDENGAFILLNKFRLERGDEIENQYTFINRDTFYIKDIDSDGDEEFIIQMATENATPHGGLHIFNHLGTEITDSWFSGNDYLGNAANGFYVDDFNNDGNDDLLMVNVYTDNYNETVFYLNNGNNFVQKTIEIEGSGWVFPVDTNQDGIFEILKFDVQWSNNSEILYNVYLNNLDYSGALGISDFENSIKIYPNPSFDYININADSNLEAILYDFLGKELIRENVTDKLDISSLEKGTYILNLTDGINTSTHKIIKE